MSKLFPISIILLYPFPIYALQNDVSINTVILVSLSLIGFSLFYLFKFKLRFTKVQLGCYFIIACIIISYLLGNTIAHLYHPDIKYIEYSASIYFISVIIFFLLLIECIHISHIDSLLKTLLLVSAVIALFIISQFFLYLLFDYKLYPPFCNELICIDSFERSSKYGYAGGYSRPSGFFNSTNRVASYLIPAVFISLFYFRKNRSKLYLLLFLIFTMSILLNLSRSGIIALMASFFLLVFILLSKNKNISIPISFSLTSLIFTVSFIIFFLFLFTAESELNYKFNPFVGQDFKGINMFLTNLRDSILVSINFYGLGVGYDIADEYLFQTDTTKLWGSHSNLVQIISGVGLIPSFFIFTFLSSLLFKSVNYFLKENDNKEILLFLFISIVGMLVTGILRTYALNYYFILIIAITYVLLNNKSTKS